ncbi:response regulator transcription factor [Halochromatium glycolicum]|uniref:DNA-binding response regulator n=1 Tax=Halochromatium glycolicum TaxID=85075 RepID=A0AAJ0U5J5_9GAMM|nr:response regulator [Halochromatium glycolicum]MBK1705684.1 DNA-binding response regulator [Halochromatium glycolicum]
MNSEPVAYIVDDDPALRDALCMLLESVSIRARAFSNATDFLNSGGLQQGGPACLLVDVRLPGISGLILLERLQESGIRIPTIMITAYGDIPMAVRAMKLGAIDFLSKPLNPQAVLELVQRTLSDADARASLAEPGSGRDRRRDREQEVLLERYARLTPREREVFEGITAGNTNQMVAEQLGISVRTAEFHRASVMKKMRARNLADLTLTRTSIEDRISHSA